MSTTRIDTNTLEPISHEDGPNPEPDGGHRRLLPWGSAPFGGINAGVGVAALPRLHLPSSGFLTLSAVFAHPYLVALFHATSTHRIPVFRAFPSPPAAISHDIRCSPVVSPASWFYRRTGLYQLALALHRPPRPSEMGYSPVIPPRTSVSRQTSS